MRQTFRITHPFHPWYGRVFELKHRRQNWGDDRVMYYDRVETLRSLPVSWTDVAIPDEVVIAGRGRAHFRAQDLLDVAELVHTLLTRAEHSSEGVK
jgi:hypothetical protein